MVRSKRSERHREEEGNCRSGILVVRSPCPVWGWGHPDCPGTREWRQPRSLYLLWPSVERWAGGTTQPLPHRSYQAPTPVLSLAALDESKLNQCLNNLHSIGSAEALMLMGCKWCRVASAPGPAETRPPLRITSMSLKTRVNGRSEVGTVKCDPSFISS